MAKKVVQMVDPGNSRAVFSVTRAQRKSEKAPPIPATPAPRTFLQQLKRDLVG